MIEFAEILRQHAKEYLNEYGKNIPDNHLKAINDILICRCKDNGGTTYYCKECKRYVYSYHSCGNRSCNKCQTELADIWFEKNRERMLDVNHFFVTFTLPQELRIPARSNQKLFFSVFFKAANEALQKLANDSRYVGGKLGMIAVLHTWARTLIYHPHIHFIVTAGGMWEDEKIFLHSKEDFLVPVIALSMIFKAKLRDMLRKESVDLFNIIPNAVWQKKWSLDCRNVGSGENALRYLSRYIFRPAISNNNILSLIDGIVTFRYKERESGQWKYMKLPALQFISRYLQHVLPNKFIKVRYYGLYANAYKKKLKDIPVKKLIKNSSKLDKKSEKVRLCEKCKKPLSCCGTFEKKYFYANGPPKKQVLLNAAYRKISNHDS